MACIWCPSLISILNYKTDNSCCKIRGFLPDSSTQFGRKLLDLASINFLTKSGTFCQDVSRFCQNNALSCTILYENLQVSGRNCLAVWPENSCLARGWSFIPGGWLSVFLLALFFLSFLPPQSSFMGPFFFGTYTLSWLASFLLSSLLQQTTQPIHSLTFNWPRSNHSWPFLPGAFFASCHVASRVPF